MKFNLEERDSHLKFIKKSLAETVIFSASNLFSSFERSYPVEAVCEAMNKPRAYVVSKLKQYRKSNYYHYSSDRVKESELDVLADLYVNNLKAKIASQVTNIESAVDQLSTFIMLFKSETYENVDAPFTWGSLDHESVRQSFIRNVKKLSSRRYRYEIFAGTGFFGEKEILSIDIILAVPFCQSPSDWYDDYDTTLSNYIYKKQTERLENYKDYILHLINSEGTPTVCFPPLLTSHVRKVSSRRSARRRFIRHCYYLFGSSDDEPDST